MAASGISNRPPVVLVILDTLRADMLRDSSLLARLPTMRELFGTSYVFTRAYATSHWTLPSHASLFTGLLPSEHFARPPTMELREDVPTLAEVFRRAGYRTVCVSCNSYVSSVFGMTRGFESVWTPPKSWTWGPGLALDYALPPAPDGGFLGALDPLAESLLSFVRSTGLVDNGGRAATDYVGQVMRDSRSPFVVLNLMEAHSPYHARGTFRSWRQRLRYREILGRYDKLRFAVMGGRVSLTKPMSDALAGIYWENVAYLDSLLGRLLRGLSSVSLNRAFLIVVSDHGQLLGEKGDLDHVAGLSEALIRVPLAIRPPGGTTGERVDHPVDLIALFSVLKGIAETGPDALPRWLDGLTDHGTVISEAHPGIVPHVHKLTGRLKSRDPVMRNDLLAFRRTRDGPAVACVSSRWKLICYVGRREDELYNVKSDPGENTNVANEHPDTVADLHRRLSERYLGLARPGSEKVARRRVDRLPLETKQAISDTVLLRAMGRDRRPALLWTGGKDSTLVLYLALQAARRTGTPLPPAILVDHGQHFPETWTFMQNVAKREGMEILVARNENALSLAKEGDEFVSLGSLDTENQEEALKAGLEGTQVPLSLNTPVGNHVLKTVALNRAIRMHRFDTIITGIRWDENPARSGEVFFSPREEPPHLRAHPILPWTEREVWTFTFQHAVPVHPLYYRGYRSLDGIHDSTPTDTRPAWEQDLEGSAERAGRGQDKEGVMERLRSLGYF